MVLPLLVSTELGFAVFSRYWGGLVFTGWVVLCVFHGHYFLGVPKYLLGTTEEFRYT
jgi:hypothetical protein